MALADNVLDLANFAVATLTTDLSSGETTEAIFDDVSPFPDAGRIVLFVPGTDPATPHGTLEREIIYYSGRNVGANKLTGLTRAREGTSAQAFDASDSPVAWRVGLASDWEDVKAALDDFETRIDVIETDVLWQESTGGDETTAIQDKIDALAAADGGQILLGPGYHNHTGLTAAAKVTMRGVNRASTVLNHTPSSGHGITVPANSDKFEVLSMILRGGGNSTDFAIYSLANISRNLTVRDCDFNNFHKGIRLSADLLDCLVDNCRFNGPTGAPAGSIAIELGTAAEGGNGVTLSNIYISTYETGIRTHAALASLERVMVESCDVGIETNAGPTVVLGTWAGSGASANGADIDINGNGILLLGYGSSNEDITYVDDSARNRTIMLPERLDVTPDANAATKVQGACIGRTIIRNYGDHNRLSMGGDDKIQWRTDTTAKGLDDGPSITSGSGAPSATEPDGSIYLRTDGSSSTTLYVRASGGWSALA